MKPKQIELLGLAFAMVVIGTMTTTLATPILSKDKVVVRDEINDRNPEKLAIRGEKVIGTCLLIAPDLPPCNFDAEATRLSRSGEIFHGTTLGSGYPAGSLPEFIADGNDENIHVGEVADHKDVTPISHGEENLEEIEFFENDPAITVVYYLEGCLPSRLPFDVPSCPINEMQTIQMNKLVPFKLPDVEDALIFPEIDVKQIEFAHRQSQAPPASEKHEESFKDRASIFGASHGNGFTIELEDIETNAKGVQDFHKTMAKSSTKPRTGMESTKYVNIPRPIGLTSISSGYPWGSRKIKDNDHRIDKNEPQPILEERSKVPGINDGITVNFQDRTREFGDILTRDKNRVQ